MTEATAQTPLAATQSGRLRYADPRSLPSYPSSGLRPDGAAAGAAATLGWNNQKPVEIWKPDKISSASAAAVLANDYKMTPRWEPSANPDGHKAALLAVGSASSALKQHASAKDQHQGWGNSAATQAFHASRPAPTEKNDVSHGSSAATQAFNASRTQSLRQSDTATPPQGDRSLIAAKGAMSSSRPRSKSTPSAPHSVESRLQASAATSALSGATMAHRASMLKSSVHDSGAVPVTTMTRNMFTANPMVKPEVDERANNERIHQSAVDMAKKMYSHQRKASDQAAAAQGDAPERAQTHTYINLQEAAYKQAQERLAKLQDEHEKNRELQEYYGHSKIRRRFTVSNKLRRRNSDEELLTDRQQSERIRQQMSMFSNKLSEVDKTKRQNDRDALMAAAQRNVKARLHGMDEKVYHETGKVNPTLLSEWEVKAHQAAQARHEGRNEAKGKLDLGGGMYMDPNDVDAIAAKRMQPILDDINGKAEAERERLAVLKLEEEARKEELEKQKARDREIKEINRKIREEDKQDQKAKKMQEKEDDKARRDQEKVVKLEQKRQAKEEKHRAKHDSAKSGIGEVFADDNGIAATGTNREDESHEAGPPEDTASRPPVAVVNTNITTQVENAGHDQNQKSPKSPKDDSVSPTSKVKGWIKNRFSRGKSLGEHDEGSEETKKRRSTFLGGISLKRSEANASSASLDYRSSSMRDVALAGKNRDEDGQNKLTTPRDSRGVSPVSSVEDDERRSRSIGGREELPFTIIPPKPIEDPAPRSSISPPRDSRFREEM